MASGGLGVPHKLGPACTILAAVPLILPLPSSSPPLLNRQCPVCEQGPAGGFDPGQKTFVLVVLEVLASRVGFRQHLLLLRA